MLLGVCCSPDRIPEARRAGADYVEPAVNAVALPEASESAWRENLGRLRDGGLPALAWNCLLPGDLKLAGPTPDIERFRRYVAVAAERLAEAGAEVVVFGSGASRSALEGFSTSVALEQFAEAVGMAADAFAPAGIRVCVEPLRRAETNVLNTVAEAVALARDIGRPNVRVTADMYHMMENGEEFAFAEAAPFLGHAHVADTARVPPGQGSADFASFFAALTRAGYAGKISIECGWTDFAADIAPSLAVLHAVSK